MDTAKAVLKGKFTAIQVAYLEKIETLQINNLTPHLHKLEKQQQTKPREGKRKENSFPKIFSLVQQRICELFVIYLYTQGYLYIVVALLQAHTALF